jgi:PAS domain S-box-containing protein
MISILCVDDESALLEVTKLFLERGGQFSVDSAASAAEALRVLKTKNYDAVISDYQMPEMNGIDFLKKVRASGSTVPFIIFTGKGREDVVIQALNEGADFYLQKGGDPVAQFTELSHKVRQAVQQRRAEANIRDLERREADIINFLPDATFAIDRSGNVIAWNRAIEEMTGVPVAEMLGKGNYEYAIPFYGTRRKVLIDFVFEPKADLAKYYTGITREKDILIAETELPHPRGRQRTLVGKASPLYNNRGEVVGAIETIRDITGLKHAELALRESERQYRNVVEDQTELICRFRPDGTHVFANPAYCRYFGRACSELIGKKFRPEIPREDRAALRQHFASLDRDHPIAAIDHRIVMPDGTIRWQRWVDRAIFDEHGALAEYQTVGRDITDVKRAEEDRRESEERYRTVIENAREAITVAQDGVWKYANPRALEMTGSDPTGLRSRPFTDFIHADDRAMVLDRYERRVRGEDPPAIYDFRVVGPGGRITWVQVSAIRITWDGRPATLNFLSDITGRKQAEEELLRMNRKLNLLAGITRHNIANQLTILLGYAELAEIRADDPVVRDFLHKVGSTAGTIGEQIEFAKIYQDLGGHAPGWHCIGDLVARIRPGEVRLTCTCGDTEVFADPMLGQIFSNLFENAVRHGGKVTEVTVRCGAGAGTGGMVIFFEDNGTGVPPGQKEKIFGEGYGKHTGLGLFLAKEILAITGITIRETGTYGSGARFELRVPDGGFRSARHAGPE